MKVYYHSFKTKMGPMWIGFTSKGIVKLNLPMEGEDQLLKFLSKISSQICEYKGKETEYSQQIDLYLEGKLKEFDVPLDLRGTEFQKNVWKELLRIPYGEVRSYRQIAELIGSPKAFRAVGGANNKNPIPIIVPCHRVIGSDGEMVGYGSGIDFKIKLLNLEGHEIINKNNKYYINNF